MWAMNCTQRAWGPGREIWGGVTNVECKRNKNFCPNVALWGRQWGVQGRGSPSVVCTARCPVGVNWGSWVVRHRPMPKSGRGARWCPSGWGCSGHHHNVQAGGGVSATTERQNGNRRQTRNGSNGSGSRTGSSGGGGGGGVAEMPAVGENEPNGCRSAGCRLTSSQSGIQRKRLNACSCPRSPAVQR